MPSDKCKFKIWLPHTLYDCFIMKETPNLNKSIPNILHEVTTFYNMTHFLCSSVVEL